MINEFTNMYNLSKTLRFSLIPYWETEEYFMERHLLDEDKVRAENYIKVKEYMDRYHRAFIEKVLNTVILNNVDEYSELYFKRNKSDAETKKIEELEATMRKQISKYFRDYSVSGEKIYPLLYKSELIKKLLPEFLTQEEEKTILAQFNDFSTYFQGFWENRENIYTDKAQSTGVPYRCINDNLPIFLDNVKSFEKIINAFPQDDIDELNNIFEGVYNTKIQDAFKVDYFSFVLSQSGIDKYNGIIGGYSNSDDSKVEGINEKVNRYNQEKAKFDKSKKLPLLKQLHKQILSDRETISFIPEKFNDDNEVLKAINDFYKNITSSLEDVNELVSKISNYDTGIIYISAGESVTYISNKVFGDWSVIRNNWNTEYELTHKKGRDEEKFYEKEREAYKKIKSFSISELQRLANSNESITDYIENESKTLFDSIEGAYKTAEPLLSNEYQHKKSLAKNDKAVELIKTFRDPENNNQFNSKSISLTQEFKNLFDNSGIDYTSNLKEQILSKDDKSFYKALIGLLSLTLQMRNSVSGNGDIDYLISPVKNLNGEFYDSRNYDSTSSLPCDADSNGAYNIARKGLWAVNQIKQAEDATKANISIKNSDWLQYAQTQNDL